ncbi:MAG: NAD-dependent epimerase/dehydratase family protein [Spirochaetales bacterium]|nr:NAD-dependent epimerase/dehydratase family protein [Spirochaetales bacterium]
MKILVTGCCGFIGSHLTERLIDLGHEVVGIDCLSDYYNVELKKLNQRTIEAKGVKVFNEDLVTADLSQIMNGVQIVFHLAAQPGISATTPFESYLSNNILATQNLLSYCKDDLTLFVNVATSSVYGKDATKSEDVAPEPASYYGVTKLAAEQLVLAKGRDSDFSACSLRLYSVFGPRERPDKMYSRLIYTMLTKQKFPLYEGSKSHVRSFTYISDIIDGMIAVMNQPQKVRGEIFNLGTEQTNTTGEAIAACERILGYEAEFELKEKRPGDQLRTHAKIDKAREILGYSPKVSLEEGIEETIGWFKNEINLQLDEINH